MKTAAAIAASLALGACAPYPVYVAPAPAPAAVVDPAQQEQCRLIRREIADQQRIAAFSGVMATALVEASTRLNAATEAALIGCPV